MDVAGILIIVDGVHVRDVGEVLVLAGSNDVHLAELGGFLGGKVREVAGDKVICLAGGHEIQRDHGKLLGGTALKETDLVVVGNVHYPAQGGLGVLDDGIEPLAAVGFSMVLLLNDDERLTFDLWPFFLADFSCDWSGAFGSSCIWY